MYNIGNITQTTHRIYSLEGMEGGMGGRGSLYFLLLCVFLSSLCWSYFVNQ